MDFFYDGQIRRYLTQYMRVMSNFSWKDGSGKLSQIPVMYGDPSRQASALLKKNSENVMPSAPFIACYIKGLDYKQDRLQDPTFVSKVQIRERAFNENTGQYETVQGNGFTVERIMPSPYELTLSADIWTTNTEQKLQIIEQLAYLFNPSLELQTTDNYLDWTSLTVLHLTQLQWTNRAVPQGTEQNIEIASLTFTTPIWITPPAKVKKLGVITKIISNVFSDQAGDIDLNYRTPDTVYPTLGDVLPNKVVTAGNFELMVLDNVATLIRNQSTTLADSVSQPENTYSWHAILDLYPGKFRANLSQIRLIKPDSNEVVAYITLDPNDERRMLLNIDTDTVPTNTVIAGVTSRGTIDAIINPETFNPGTPVTGKRYLILEDIISDPVTGPEAWLQGNGSGFTAVANDIIEWNGSQWNVIFSSAESTEVTYITNSYTNIQYKWDGESWSKSYEGIYTNELWRMIL
jgi:hypothetical protein